MQEMQQIYATGTVGDAERCIRLEAGGTGEESLEDIMANSGSGSFFVTSAIIQVQFLNLARQL